MTEPGVRILADRYHLVETVGRGGMGAVWRARDRLLGRDVAVKEILLPQGLDDEQLATVRGRALREARAAAHVRHPSVVTIHDVVIEDDHPWIVMDFVRASSLADRIDEAGALPIAEVARVGSALAGALRAIHAEGIVHRDLKPANVLIDADGAVVLTDFGIATIEGDARFTASGMMIGTPGYMAPERLSGEPTGPPSDLWSLGAVLYTAVEGRRPYEGGTPMVIASAVLTGEPAPPRRAGALGPLIGELLARDPAARPDAGTTAGHLASLATPPRSGQATRADPPPARPAATRAEPRPAKSRRAEAWAAEQGRRDALRAPLPTGEVRERSAAVRALRRILTPGGIAAVVVVLLLGLGIDWLANLPSGDSDSDSIVDPCAVLSAKQVAQLALNGKGVSLPPDCTWNGTVGTSLTVTLKSYSNDGEAATALHNGQGDFVSDYFLEADQIGNEAFAYSDQESNQVTVLFRRDRQYVRVAYKGTSEKTEKSEAFQAARWADQSLRVIDE